MQDNNAGNINFIEGRTRFPIFGKRGDNMHLISLELQGFKSFPDKVKLDFGKGITGVVGPNGSGKSNIGDAMRWVLGEQSTKTLRGGKMEDVIFTGTEKRKAVSFALATLNIDNTDRSLMHESDVVSVTRKLYRNGDSEYSINGEQVRLKDVVELFMDTGLGKDGYSIIGQGKIADIVSSKSSERREIFEEAAGISKFRYKKLQAERKLLAAQDNILRLTDILAELESRVEPLRVQSEKAKKFLALDGEKRSLEISVWVHRMDEIKTVLDGLSEKLEALNSQYAENCAECDRLERSAEDSLADAASCAEKIEQERERIHEIELEISQADSKIAVLNNDILHINEAIESLNTQIEQTYSSAEKLRADKEQKLLEAKETQDRMVSLDSKISQTEKALSELSDKDDMEQKTIATQSEQISTLYIRSSELSFLLENSKNTSAELTEQTELSINAKNEAEAAYDEAVKERRELNTALDNLNIKLSEYQNKLGGFQLLSGRKQTELDNAQKAFRDCDIELRDKTQKLRLLNDLENSMEGFSRSVKQVIKASKQGQIKGILGSVAQLVTTKPEYSLAIETALGASLQNIIVENEDTAKRCIRYLKEQNAGRATFLPLTSVKGKDFSESGLSSCDGYVALASELVSYDSKLSPIVSSLLGRTVVAEDIDLATVIAKKYSYRFKLVTLDGQVINAGGSFTGGSANRSAGILTRRNEIDELSRSVEALNGKHSDLGRSAQKLKQELDKLNADSEGYKETISEMNTDKVRFETEIKRVTDVISQLDARLDELDSQLATLSSKLSSADSDFDTAQAELADVKKQIEEQESLIAISQQAQSDSKQQREQLSQRLSGLRLHRVELVKDREACYLAAQQIDETIASLSGGRDELQNKISKAQDEIEQKNTEIANIKESISNSGERTDEIERNILSLQSRHRTLDEKSSKERAMLKIKNEERESLSQNIARVSEKQISTGEEYDKIVSSLWEQYELSKSEAVNAAQPLEDVAEANKRLTELRNKIKHLGNVNVGAVEEYIEVSERYEFLSEELSDVTTSKSELEKLIAELTGSMKEIFSESFAKINENFKRIFVELFGGGRAELKLDNPDDILECGIDINVAPPGKVIKNLSLLSGGEQAFVAIAIYFAILAVKPSPFCLLDEIEAALDDVNVTKYAQYLRKFTDTTQFIAITHRRGTMEEADVLYGVTMQEKGVSKLLKMNVSEASQTLN